MQKRMQECSRHRDKFRAPGTPEHFWTLGFPDTAEDVVRGTWNSVSHFEFEIITVLQMNLDQIENIYMGQ